MSIDDLFGRTGLGPNNQAQVDALRTIIGLGLGATALGAGSRAMSGVGNFLGRNLGGPARTPMRQSFVRIPVPVAVRTPAERDAMLAATEEKEAEFAKLAFDMRHVADWMGLLRRPGQVANTAQNWLGGWGAKSPLDMPWAIPAGVAAVGAGGYGGWKLTDYLLDKTRTAEQESELEEARKGYESALAGRRKLASADPKPSSLDVLASLYEKQAEGWYGPLMGGALTLGGGLMLGAGLGGYHWARSTAEDKAVEEAVKRRQAQIAEQAPSPIMAIPMPTPIMRPKPSIWHRAFGARKEPDEEPAKKEKHASVGQAADQFLNRIKANQMAVWNRLMTPTDGKPAKPEKPAEPSPPQLPSLAGSLGRVAGQQLVQPHPK
jgi:hypothetical protein